MVESPFYIHSFMRIFYYKETISGYHHLWKPPHVHLSDCFGPTSVVFLPTHWLISMLQPTKTAARPVQFGKSNDFHHPENHQPSPGRGFYDGGKKSKKKLCLWRCLPTGHGRLPSPTGTKTPSRKPIETARPHPTPQRNINHLHLPKTSQDQ